MISLFLMDNNLINKNATTVNSNNMLYCFGCEKYHEVCTLLRTCKHYVCYECLSTLVSAAISNYGSEIKCPKCNVKAFTTLCADKHSPHTQMKERTSEQVAEARATSGTKDGVVSEDGVVLEQGVVDEESDAHIRWWRRRIAGVLASSLSTPLWKQITSGLCSPFSLEFRRNN